MPSLGFLEHALHEAWQASAAAKQQVWGFTPKGFYAQNLHKGWHSATRLSNKHVLVCHVPGCVKQCLTTYSGKV